jgi:hypothetical protein
VANRQDHNDDFWWASSSRALLTSAAASSRLGATPLRDRATLQADEPWVNTRPVGVDPDGVAAVAGRPEPVPRVLLGLVLHRRHAGDRSLSSPVTHETHAWGIPGAWSSGQQGAPAVCHGHFGSAIYLRKCSVPAAPCELVFS